VATVFWAVVAFSSVYLNHHYVVDGLAGMAFAVAAWGSMFLWRRLGSRR
jgi:membrane-associated phospholipid phosphatase